MTIFTVDVTDQAAVKRMAEETEQWNVLIHAAGYMNSPAPVAKADIVDYWKSYELCNTMEPLLISHDASKLMRHGFLGQREEHSHRRQIPSTESQP